MEKRKKRKLEQKGWSVGTVEEFLTLADNEAAYIEIGLALNECPKWRPEQD